MTKVAPMLEDNRATFAWRGPHWPQSEPFTWPTREGVSDSTVKPVVALMAQRARIRFDAPRFPVAPNGSATPLR